MKYHRVYCTKVGLYTWIHDIDIAISNQYENTYVIELGPKLAIGRASNPVAEAIQGMLFALGQWLCWT